MENNLGFLKKREFVYTQSDCFFAYSVDFLLHNVVKHCI